MSKKTLLERLAEGPVVGDGSFVVVLEKRGYVKAGAWTPEATVQYPQAVRQLHEDYLRAGADVMQTFTFYASDDKLESHLDDKALSARAINQAGCDLAKEVASSGGALVAGSISEIPSLEPAKNKDHMQRQFRSQIEIFTKNDVDFILCEFFNNITELEWAIEVCKETSKTVAATMNIGQAGDSEGVSPADCAVRMARAGAEVVGLNCFFDPPTMLQTIRLMKAGLEKAGLSPYLMTQPNGWWSPDAGPGGYTDLPEFPFAMEPRLLTRIDVHKYAREAYELGVRYIGGCCAFEPYHIRAIAEELAPERGRMPPGSDKHKPWGGVLADSRYESQKARASRSYWEHLEPATGRPFSAALSRKDTS